MKNTAQSISKIFVASEAIEKIEDRVVNMIATNGAKYIMFLFSFLYITYVTTQNVIKYMLLNIKKTFKKTNNMFNGALVYKAFIVCISIKLIKSNNSTTTPITPIIKKANNVQLLIFKVETTSS